MPKTSTMTAPFRQSQCILSNMPKKGRGLSWCRFPSWEGRPAPGEGGRAAVQLPTTFAAKIRWVVLLKGAGAGLGGLAGGAETKSAPFASPFFYGTLAPQGFSRNIGCLVRALFSTSPPCRNATGMDFRPCRAGGREGTETDTNCKPSRGQRHQNSAVCVVEIEPHA